MRYIYIDVAGRYRYLYKFQPSTSKFTKNQHDFSFGRLKKYICLGLFFVIVLNFVKNQSTVAHRGQSRALLR